MGRDIEVRRERLDEETARGERRPRAVQEQERGTSPGWTSPGWTFARAFEVELDPVGLRRRHVRC